MGRNAGSCLQANVPAIAKRSIFATCRNDLPRIKKPSAPSRAAFAATCLIFISLSGCTAFHPKPLSPAQTLTAFDSRSLDNPALKGFLEQNLGQPITPWPLKAWNFTTLTLAACFYNPEITLARTKWETAQAAFALAGQRPNPVIGLTPGYATNAASGISPWIFIFGSRIPVETDGRRSDRLARAAHLSDAAGYRIAITAWQVRSRLRENLLDDYYAMQKAKISKSLWHIQTDYVRLLKQRLEAGYASRPDLIQARIELDKTQLLLGETQGQIAHSRAKTAETLGVPVSAIRNTKISFDFLNHFPPRLDFDQLRGRALLNRPDILSMLSEYEAAQAALKLEIAKQYPDLILGPGYEYDQGENKWRLGFSFVLPLFNRNQGAIAEADAHRSEISARFAALQASVIGEIDLALAGYEKSTETYETAKTLSAAQEKEAQSIQAGVEAGEEDRLALLGAKLQVNAIAFTRLEAWYAAQKALASLEKALWCPLETDGACPGGTAGAPKKE